jgi:stage V sporulation protein SpoVS
MTTETLIQAITTTGAWARASKIADVAHYFINHNGSSLTCISKCFRRVTIMSNVVTPDDVIHCPLCEEILSLERMVQHLPSPPNC